MKTAPTFGPCEAMDWVPVGDGDADAVVCGRPGQRVVETDGRGHQRTRIACPSHAVDMENAPS